jgi:hypothetical protein
MITIGTSRAQLVGMSPVVTLRVATTEDLPELQRLSSASIAEELEPTSPPTPARRRYVLVVDAPFGGLAAATIVALEPPQAHLEALLMDDRCASPALEARLIGVAEALAQAFGCRSLDVRRQRAA